LHLSLLFQFTFKPTRVFNQAQTVRPRNRTIHRNSVNYIKTYFSFSLYVFSFYNRVQSKTSLVLKIKFVVHPLHRFICTLLHFRYIRFIEVVVLFILEQPKQQQLCKYSFRTCQLHAYFFRVLASKYWKDHGARRLFQLAEQLH